MQKDLDLSIFNGKVLLVTGGTGSFGNVVLCRFLKTGVGEIRIFSRDEKKQDEMRHSITDSRVKFFIGDVRDYESVQQSLVGVDYVFHAAALKQVPSCEFFPQEAVKTNILGTDNVLNAATAMGVKKVICLSTDKAVLPINAMGMTKALMEKVMVARSRTSDRTLICGTRYGNVIASRGSVIPLFVGQIKAGLPLTITDAGMTRFMMSLESAVDLVLFAFVNGKPGDLFVQKSPAASIGDLATALLDLFGAKNEVRTIGTRHGEKLYETLLSREERARTEEIGDYYRIKPDNRDLNYSKYFTEGEAAIASAADYTSHNTRRLSVGEIKSLLLTVDYVKRELKG